MSLQHLYPSSDTPPLESECEKQSNPTRKHAPPNMGGFCQIQPQARLSRDVIRRLGWLVLLFPTLLAHPQTWCGGVPQPLSDGWDVHVFIVFTHVALSP